MRYAQNRERRAGAGLRVLQRNCHWRYPGCPWHEQPRCGGDSTLGTLGKSLGYRLGSGGRDRHLHDLGWFANSDNRETLRYCPAGRRSVRDLHGRTGRLPDGVCKLESRLPCWMLLFRDFGCALNRNPETTDHPSRPLRPEGIHPSALEHQTIHRFASEGTR